MIKGLLDLMTVKFLTGFGHRPLHLLGTFGLVSFFLGLLCLVYLAGYWVISRLVDARSLTRSRVCWSPLR